jgi:hypothetical protein
MNLATLHADVAAVLARGASQDAKVPRWVRHSAMWLEQNYSFKYMEKHGESALNPLAEAPNVLQLPNNRIKSVTLVQPFRMEDDGRKSFSNPLPKADRRDVLSIDLGYPSGWWQIGETLHFDGKPEQTFNLDLVWFEYTDWPVDTNTTPTLLQRYENLLFAQTLVAAWRELKDQAAMQDWTNERNEALRAILVAEDADVWEAQDLRMNPAGSVMPQGYSR